MTHIPALPSKVCVEIDGVVCGAQPDERGPLGGGAGYGDIITDGDYRVANVDGLLDALAKATAGQVIYVEPDAAIDLTDWVYSDALVLTIPAGVTLAGNRGEDGVAGPTIFSDALQTNPLIRAAGAGVRITGLRLRGPDPKRRLAFHYRSFFPGGQFDAGGSKTFYSLPNSAGIECEHDLLTVDNCEISGFSHAGIIPKAGKGHDVHHNFIHHCQRMGLGYGITHSGASESRITHNVFQDNKHDIAGTGEPGQCYAALHNVVLPATESHAHPVTGNPYGQDHTFDMHGGEDRKDGTNIAGHTIEVAHNTVLTSYQPVAIRGVPQVHAHVHHNWFAQRDDIVGCVRTQGATTVEANALGPSPATLS